MIYNHFQVPKVERTSIYKGSMIQSDKTISNESVSHESLPEWFTSKQNWCSFITIYERDVPHSFRTTASDILAQCHLRDVQLNWYWIHSMGTVMFSTIGRGAKRAEFSSNANAETMAHSCAITTPMFCSWSYGAVHEHLSKHSSGILYLAIDCGWGMKVNTRTTFLSVIPSGNTGKTLI